MQKFIRTEDKIYELKETNTYCGTKFYTVQDENELEIKVDYMVREEYVVATADTIEELCDCFVAVGNKHTVWDKQHCLGLTFEQVKYSYSTYDFKVYGAIWTDKGLIYVAKMNDKGELELI